MLSYKFVATTKLNGKLAYFTHNPWFLARIVLKNQLNGQGQRISQRN